MSDTVFVNGVTLTDADWMNDVNRLHYTIFGDPANLAAVQSVLLLSQFGARGHLSGLTLSNNGSDVTNDIDIAEGMARDSTNAQNLVLAASITKRLDASWAVGTNQGGLDTGVIADDVYHVWLIKRSDTGVVDVLFSASASSPSMPTNYDFRRRIGAIKRESAAIVLFTQIGDTFIRSVISGDVNAAACSATAGLNSLSVPDGIKVTALIRGNLIATGGVGHLFTSPDESDQGAGSVGAYSLVCANNGEQAAGHFAVRTNTSGQIRSRSSTTSGTYSVGTYGWIDRRGVND